MLTQSSKLLPWSQLLPQFQCRPVRDLAWALLSPSLFNTIPDCPEEWFIGDYIDDDCLPWLHELNAEPALLYQHLAEQRSTRLGIYFEQLLSFYFEYFPRFQLLAKNLQVNSKQRTLGEFDFILYDKKKNQTRHIEAAVKFYLGHTHYRGHIQNNTPLYNWHHWVGPNQKDSLAIKMRHLKSHQLLLSETDAGKRTLEKIAVHTEIKSHLLIKGQFYLPTNNTIPLPDFHNTLLKPHYWVNSYDFLKDKKEINTQRHYLILPRAYWLSPLTKDDPEVEENNLLKADELTQVIKERVADNENEWHVAELDFSNKEKIESKRFFIVNSQHLPSDK